MKIPHKINLYNSENSLKLPLVAFVKSVKEQEKISKFLLVTEEDPIILMLYWGH